MATVSLPRILVIDDQYGKSPVVRRAFLRAADLIEAGGDPDAARSGSLGIAAFCTGQRECDGRLVNDYAVVREAVAREEWSLILLDVRFDSGPPDSLETAIDPADADFGESVREQLLQEFPALPIVMLTSVVQEELRDPDTPYLSKQGLSRRELAKRLLAYGKLDSQQASEILRLGEVVAESGAMRNAFYEAYLHAASDVPVLLLGESGTGKEVLARYLHAASSRAGKPFVTVNTAAIPAELIESELFGAEKGAFTGATVQRQGLFEQASGGTLFLDEIGDMPANAQAKLLRALQERKISRLGGKGEIDVDIRLISATSRDLPALCASGAFREDLLHRINTVPIRLPPLRDRRTDVAPLARNFLAKYAAAANMEGISFSYEALDLLSRQDFPGNVRELENVIRRLVSDAGHNELITPAKLAHLVGGSAEPAPVSVPETKRLDHQGIPMAELLTALEQVVIDPLDPKLAGILPMLDAAVAQLRQQLAGAVLVRCTDPLDGTRNRQKAMQYLTGDRSLRGKEPGRLVNELLGKRRDAPIDDADLESLIDCWQKNKFRGGNER